MVSWQASLRAPRVSLAPKTPFPFPSLSNACHAGYRCTCSNWSVAIRFHHHQNGGVYLLQRNGPIKGSMGKVERKGDCI